MIGGIVEIADAGRHVSVHRGFVRVSEGGDEIGCVPLDDVTALILSGPQTTLSKQLMVELAERKADRDMWSKLAPFVTDTASWRAFRIGGYST